VNTETRKLERAKKRRQLNLSDNFKHGDRECICCGKPELDWVEQADMQRDYPVCEICQACYEITKWAEHSISYLKKIILFIENPE